jgi:O-antigen ligase
MLAQAVLGILQVATRRVGGVLAIFGLGESADAALQQAGEWAIGGWIRAQGTIGHPSNLACYFLIPIPLFLALGFSLRRRALRLVSLFSGAVGVAGLVCTLSRWPWVLLAVQTVFLAAGLAWARSAPTKRIVGTACITAFLAMAAVLPLSDFIYDRFTRDLKASLEFRAKQNKTAFALAEQSPFFGAGLNNYRLHLLRYEPELEWAFENEDKMRLGLSRRVFVMPHNLYLALLAETGYVGLGTFLLFVGGAVWTGVRAVIRTTGAWRAACLGLTLGLAAALAQQLVDFSLWVDPVLMTFAVGYGMLLTAPALSESEGHAQRTG